MLFRSLSADEREQFDALLEEQANPFEEQAINIHEVNAKRTVDGLYDESVRRSFQALAELSPARYAKSELWCDLLRTLVAPAGADFTRGVAAALSGNATDAELDFKQMELHYPQLVEPSINLGIVLQGEGKLAEAAEALQRATAHASANAVAWTALGLVQRSLGKFAAAKAAYAQAIASDASYAPARRNLGVLLDLYLADPATALAEMEQYRQLSGEDKPVSGWIAELRHRTGIKAPPAAVPPAPAAVVEPAAAVEGAATK